MKLLKLINKFFSPKAEIMVLHNEHDIIFHNAHDIEFVVNIERVYYLSVNKVADNEKYYAM
jgi:hypothetical protein